MSLIDEALKRARQEAARQDAEARELRYRQVPVIPGLRQRPRRSWLLPAVIAGCLAAGIGIGAGLTLARNDGKEILAAATPPAPSVTTAAPAPVLQETPAEAPTPPPPAVEEAQPVVEEESPAPVPPAPVAPPTPAPLPQEEPRMVDMRTREISLTPAAPRPQPETPPAPAPTPPAPASSTPTAPEPSDPAPAAPGEVRTYQQELPLAGGGTLRLSGIAFSEQPVALFGDKVVAPGETVAGYKVVAIEARRVRLEGAEGAVVVVELP